MKKKTRVALRPPYAVLTLSVAFFALCGAVLAHEARTNRAGLILSGVIELGPSGADLFYGVLAALSFGFVALGAVSIARFATGGPIELVVTESSITIPHIRLGRAQARRVRFEDVLAVSASNGMLVVSTRQGPRFVSARYLPPEWPVDKLAAFVVERWRGAT